MDNGEMTRSTDVSAAAWLLNTVGKAIALATVVGIGAGVVAAVLVLAAGGGWSPAIAIGSALAFLAGPLTFAGVLNNAQP